MATLFVRTSPIYEQNAMFLVSRSSPCVNLRRVAVCLMMEKKTQKAFDNSQRNTHPSQLPLYLPPSTCARLASPESHAATSALASATNRRNQNPTSSFVRETWKIYRAQTKPKIQIPYSRSLFFLTSVSKIKIELARRVKQVTAAVTYLLHILYLVQTT